MVVCFALVGDVMKKILVFGLTRTVGGVESYIRNLIYNIDRSKYLFDFMIVGEPEKACFEDEFNALFNDGFDHFYHCPNMKRNFWATNKWLKNFYQMHHYDLIYMNVTTAARIMYCNYAITKQNIPLITHNHCASAVTKLASLNNNLFKRYTTKRSLVKLACSNEAFDYGFTCSKNDGIIINNGIDLKRFEFNAKVRREMRIRNNISDEQVVIGHVGRFAQEKNQSFFIDLSELLGERYIFVCVGAGSLREQFIQEIHEKKLDNRFRIVSFSNETEKLYSMMDMFVMPSLYEGLPLVAVEAQASGLPCIFSDTISRQADICKNSSFISLGNKEEWVSIIRKQPIKRYDNMQSLVDAGFDIKTTAKEIERIFSAVWK
jgi:glycosyltransferase involved in cell wall biosynthesis